MYNVYLVSSEIEGDICYKIGYTRRDPQKRIKEMKTGNASHLKLENSFKSRWGTQIESLLHRYFKTKKISGEWFKLEREDINKFSQICEQAHNNLENLSENNLHFQNTKLFKKFGQTG